MGDTNGQDRPYLTAEQLAGRVGVSVRTVRRWVAETDIPHRRVGDVIRFVFDEVDEWMKARAQPAETGAA